MSTLTEQPRFTLRTLCDATANNWNRSERLREIAENALMQLMFGKSRDGRLLDLVLSCWARAEELEGQEEEIHTRERREPRSRVKNRGSKACR